MPRITITRAVMGKLTTQLRKPENSATMILLRAAKKTENPAHDTIMWDPSAPLLRGLINQCNRELSFTRKQESMGYKQLQENVARLQNELSRLESTAPTPANDAQPAS